MSAVDLRSRLLAAGVSVEVSHDGPLPTLRLTASAAPSAALLNEVRQGKADLIALIDAETPMPAPYAPEHRTRHRGSSGAKPVEETADFGRFFNLNPDTPYAPYGSGPAASFAEDRLEAGIYDEPEMPASGTAARERMDREHRNMCRGLLAMARRHW